MMLFCRARKVAAPPLPPRPLQALSDADLQQRALSMAADREACVTESLFRTRDALLVSRDTTNTLTKTIKTLTIVLVVLTIFIALLTVVMAWPTVTAWFTKLDKKQSEALRPERPTAWYLLVVHDYALYQGLTKQVSKDAEWLAVGVFQTESDCSDYYMKGNVSKTAEDFDRFWGCLPNTDPELSRRRINWQQLPHPFVRRGP